MMVRNVIRAILVVGLVIALPAYGDECVLPPPPSKIPDGATASKQQMINAMNTLKEYNGDVNVYLECLDFQTKRNRMPSELRDLKHDAAITQLQTIADKFNQQVRVFKSKHG